VVVFPVEQLLPTERTVVPQLRVTENHAAIRDAEMARRRFEAEVNKNSRSGPLPEREMIG
jgi:hypothetical protein